MATILVIDDDPVTRGYARMILARAGHHILEAAGGREGLHIYRDGGVDLLVCDLFMPDMDGLEVIREVRGHSPDAKIIAVSAGSSDGRFNMLPTAERLGADAVLGKPYKPGELVERVQALLGVPV